MTDVRSLFVHLSAIANLKEGIFLRLRCSRSTREISVYMYPSQRGIVPPSCISLHTPLNTTPFKMLISIVHIIFQNKLSLYTTHISFIIFYKYNSPLQLSWSFTCQTGGRVGRRRQKYFPRAVTSRETTSFFSTSLSAPTLPAPPQQLHSRTT